MTTRFDPDVLLKEFSEEMSRAGAAAVSQAALTASYALTTLGAVCKFHRKQVPGLTDLAEDLHYLGSVLSDYAEGESC